jgi:hypothetical protein
MIVALSPAAVLKQRAEGALPQLLVLSGSMTMLAERRSATLSFQTLLSPVVVDSSMNYLLPVALLSR